jgi:hypothetical protein
MSNDSTARNPWDEPGVFQYFVICLSALGAILLLLLQRGFGIWSLLPILAGLGGSATRFGPILLLVAVAMSINAPPEFGLTLANATGLDVPDLILCGALLAYTIAHYRLQSLLTFIFPPDPRRRTEARKRPFPYSLWAPGPKFLKERRDASLVTRQEIGRAVLILPAFAALAQICWRVLPRGNNPGIYPPVWQAVVLAWLIGLIFLTTATIIGYWYRQQMTSRESLVYLQDVLWKETRREQRRANRWLAWARLRQSKRKGE